jgi:hypothetical protein
VCDPRWRPGIWNGENHPYSPGWLLGSEARENYINERGSEKNGIRTCTRGKAVRIKDSKNRKTFDFEHDEDREVKP